MTEEPMTDNDTPAGTEAAELLKVITWAIDNAPRSLQAALGPSEVGQPCERRLTLQMLDANFHNTAMDKWAATVGTAVHTWLAEMFTADNERLKAAGQPPRWLIEQRVTIRPGLTGSCDLYDLETHTVIDWKTAGVTRLRGYRTKRHPGQQYETQAHLYGMGWANYGLPVRHVAVMFLPRSGLLRDHYMWTDRYDPLLAEEALERMDDLLANADVAEGEGRLADYMLSLRRDTEMCGHCPYFTTRPNIDPTDACRGGLENLAPGEKPAPAQALSGIF